MARRSAVFESVEYIGFRFLGKLAGMLPHGGVRRLGSAVGMAGYGLRIRRSVTLDNLRHAFPELDEKARRSIARGAYRNYGVALAEMLWSAHAPETKLRSLVVPVRLELLTDAYARGKGVVLLSAHFGCWELIATSLVHFIPGTLKVIAQTQRNRRVDEYINRGRMRFGTVLVPMPQAPREVLTTLKAGGVVAMLGDQSGASESPYVRFFGRPAATHRGPAVFALKSGAPLVVYFFVRQPGGFYEAHFEEVDRSNLTGTLEEQILELTQRHVALLEHYIRQYPDYWLWMHKRWKHSARYMEQKGHV